MSLNRIVICGLACSGMIFLNISVAFADDLQQASGGQSAGGDHFRIKRDTTPKFYGRIEHTSSQPATRGFQSDSSGPVVPQYGQMPAPQYGQIPAPQPQAVPYAGNASTFASSAVTRKRGNYIWQQSAVNGYYDATGQVKDLVPGDQLYLYGGKFADGTEVPFTPVVCNFKAHVYFPFVVKR